MSYGKFSSHDASENFVREQGVAVAQRVPYRFTRKLLFNARVIHRRHQFSFSGDRVLDPWINLTYS